MAYSNFTRKQAGVLYAQKKNGNIVMTDAAIRMMYDRADAYINHDAVNDDIEAKLRNAVDAAMTGDFKTAQEEVDLACHIHDYHFDGERTKRTPRNTVECWAVVDKDGEIVETFFAFDEDSKDKADECAKGYNDLLNVDTYKVKKVFA